MPMNEEVRKAVENLDGTALAGLSKHVDRVCELQSRLAAANALLRECYEWLFEDKSDGPRVSEGALEKGYYTPALRALHKTIQAHLSEPRT